MKAYHGILERVGDGTWVNGTTQISIIKIGNTMLSNVSADDRMYSFLDIDRPMTIYIHRFMFFRKTIIGVSHNDGDKICIRLGTVLLSIISISFIWLFLGIIFWTGCAALFGWLSCASYTNHTPIENIDRDACMNRAMLMATIASIGAYIACIFHLIKDYILVKSLTLLGK